MIYLVSDCSRRISLHPSYATKRKEGGSLTFTPVEDIVQARSGRRKAQWLQRIDPRCDGQL